jgi:hypothetical protein
MTAIETPSRFLAPEGLEARLRALWASLAGGAGANDLELRHLLEILTRSVGLVSGDYDPATLDAILSGEPRPSSLLEPILQEDVGGAQKGRRLRVLGVPDTLRVYGDKALYDVGLAGRETFRGVDLRTLGPRAYDLASQVLGLLAEDRRLRDFYRSNLVERLPIEEEILFLRQCAVRFRLHARILQALKDDDKPPEGRVAPAGLVVAAPPAAATPVASEAPRAVRGEAMRAERRTRPAAAAAEASPEPSGLDREERLAAYERALLFASLDVGRLRARLEEMVVDQAEAVRQICEDLAVHALGTQARPRPQSYLLVGPTGVGKNYLIETLVGELGRVWGAEVPLLTIEGPQYTYPSDVGELKGSTRGFIRSDEEGLLAEFHGRARVAPLSFLLVDEVEKAHVQLIRYFLSIMDRGATLDNRGRLLRFPATILAFTSNLGYSDEPMQGRSIGYSGRDSRAPAGRGAASRTLRRGLPPEFLNRLRVLHFSPLSRRSAERILEHEIARIAERYSTLHGIELRVTPAARRGIVDLGFSEEYGARHLVRQTERILNVEVGLRIQERRPGLSQAGKELLETIRAARGGARAIDEEALRGELLRETRLRRAVARVTVDRSGDGFAYRVDET